MKPINEYLAMIKELMERSSAIDTTCTADGRDPTEEELTEKERCMDEATKLRRTVEILKRERAMVKELTKKPEPETKPNPATIIRDEHENEHRFSNPGEQLVAVMNAGIGRGIDPRLLTRAASGLSEGVPSEGGFLLQEDFSAAIMQEIWNTGVLASRTRRIPISANSNSLKINGLDETSRVAGSRGGGVLGYWTAEAGEKVGSKPKFRQIDLKLNKLIGLCYATDELLDDSAALETVIRQAFVAEFGFLIDDAIINGSGAGQPLGILNAGCVVSVTKESGQAATTLVYENIINMWSRLFAPSRSNSVWLINQDVEPQLHTMSLAVGTGGVPVYMPASGASASPYSTLFGRPVIPIEQCQTLGTTGDIFLADFMGGYVMAEKGGIASDMSIHVRFVYDESVFRFVIRLDGQPVLASAITPYKGSNTLSHFVKLDTRA